MEKCVISVTETCFLPGGHPLFSTNPKALQILLYYDDFEIANPLGAKATIHKIGKTTILLFHNQ